MNKRRSPRILSGPESVVRLRSIDGAVLRAPLLDQSVDGIAIQAGRTCNFQSGDHVEVQIGGRWEEAIVMTAERRGVQTRLGIKWLAEYQEPLDELAGFGNAQP